ncbi:4-hydroxyphenylpyruvate dioxygenase [Sphaerisporangium aureirubrum]|uniref:4-hydroxyphenylpyruvate dioxygenase n=1 Tax=Sphaerisporangium aureirubrum TaxID=1544736 RepID=A0ABW1NHA6_9ACTN
MNHVEFYVSDADAVAGGLTTQYGFRPVARSGPGESVRSIALRQGGITLVVTSAASAGHLVSEYVETHGDGVASIALRVDDARQAFDRAVTRGARPVSAPAPLGDGGVAASIQAFGDVALRFVQLPSGAGDNPVPWLPPVADAEDPSTGLQVLDHFAVCLPPGGVDPHVRFFEKVLGFTMIFKERTVAGEQVMDSKVVQNAAGDITLVLLEPGHIGGEPGQIDEFVKANSGPGVQHIAFSCEDIVRTAGTLQERGVEFLNPPDSYYEMVSGRVPVLREHTLEELERLNILADQDHDGLLFQSFTRSATPRRTYFFEVIERAGATTFGSGNIKALYEAVELEQSRQKS